jgi:uncharacterized protein
MKKKMSQNNKKYAVTLVFMLVFAAATTAQNTPRGMRLIARSMGDSIVLRWAVFNPVEWQMVNKYGYLLERATLVDKTNKVEQTYTPLSKDTLRPWTNAECKVRINGADNRYAALATQALYGKTFATTINKPDDNGGLSTIVKAAEEAENRHAMALLAADVSALAADVLGLRYVDRNVKKGYKYIYRLRAVPHPQGLYDLDSVSFVIALKDVEYLPPVEGVTTTGYDGHIQINWRKTLEVNKFTAFFIERSEDNKIFTPLSKEPFIQFQQDEKSAALGVVTYTDTAVMNYKTYYYRVRGIDAFAQLSPYSTSIEGKALDLTPTATPNLNRIDKRNATTYTLNWEMPKTPQISNADLKGFLVLRCDKIDGKYKTLTDNLLAPTVFQFTDNTASDTKENFYAIVAVDTAGNVASSQSRMVFSYDATPPAKPVGLTGRIDTNGIVTVKWQMGKEADLKGYYVYFANSADHEFTAAAPDMIIDTVFLDSIRLKVLTKHIYYKIVAIDNNLNASAYSDVFELTKPDVVPPVRPVIGRFVVSDSTVLFNWATSASTDVAQQNVYRRLSPNGDWQLLTALKPTIDRYVDRDFGRDKAYQYCIEAVDSAGLKSPKSYPLSIRTLATNLAQLTAKNIVATFISEKKTATLTWETPKTDEKITDWLVYRTAEDGTWDLLTTTKTERFEDRNLSKKKEVKYAVKARFGSGAVSYLAVSNVLSIP